MHVLYLCSSLNSGIAHGQLALILVLEVADFAVLEIYFFLVSIIGIIFVI